MTEPVCLLCGLEPRLADDRMGAKCRQRVAMARRQHDSEDAEHEQRQADKEEAAPDRKVNDDLAAIKEGDWPNHRLARMRWRR